MPQHPESYLDDDHDLDAFPEAAVEHEDERDDNTDPEEIVEFFGYRKVVACIDHTGGRFRGF